MSRTSLDPRDGALGDFTGGLYWLAAIQVALLIATTPTIVGFLLLERHPSNLILFAAFAIAVGPAFQAALYAMRERPRGGDLRPFSRFWRGWRMGLGQSLAIWVPAMAVTGMALTTWAFQDEAQISPFFAIGGMVVAGCVVLWAIAALTVIAHFSFRTSDLIRVVLYGLGARPLVPLGMVSMMALVVVLLAFTSDLVVAFLGVLLVYAHTLVVRPTIVVVREVFVTPPE